MSDIAIVGMACLFPKAPDVATFWQNILGKVDAMTEAPPEWDGVFNQDPTAAGDSRIYTRRGGFLGDLARFDPFQYGVIPRAVDGAEPEHFIALRIAHEALADAGYADRPFNRQRTGVILGRGTYWNRGSGTLSQHVAVDQTIRLLATLHPEHSAAELARIKEELQAGLPPFNADTAPGLVPSVMCGRIANRLDLMGPAYAVDAACASSLIAIEHAIQELASGKADMVLAGGVHISTTPPIMLVFCQLGALSRQGQVRSFSPDADGTLMGEGAGVVVLKRREDAERDGDRIYALVKAVGVASDGRAMGLLAPRVEGEELAMRRAYEQAGLAPSTVSLVDGHGTGTLIGDAVEIEALGRVFGSRDGDRPSCALGSVKSMIGHPIPAAGVAGVIKTALALYHKVLPPTLHAGEGHRKLASTPFYLNTETRPWVHGAAHPRRAAVSAFGFGGINAHAILEEHPASRPASRPEASPNLHRAFDAEVVILAADSRAELVRRGAELRSVVTEHPGYALVDLAYTLNCPQPEGTHRLAIVASSLEDLDRKLAGALDRLGRPDASTASWPSSPAPAGGPGCHALEDGAGVYYTAEPLYAPGALAFLFPGQGAQYPNMLADLCVHFPEVRSWFDLADHAFAQHERADLPSLAVFALPSQPPTTALWAMDVGLAAVASANQAVYGLLSRLGIRPDAVLGHSMGDSCALWAAGVLRLDDADLAEQSLLAAQFSEQAHAEGRVPSGALLAVSTADREPVLALVERVDGLFMVMDNSPRQVVIGGSAEAVAAATAELGRAGATCMPLPIDRPYHTPYFTPYTDRLAELYGQLEGQIALAPPAIPMYSCVTAARCPDDPDTIAELVTRQASSPVRFRETIAAMHRDGVRIFVEVGPRGGLVPFVDDTLSGLPHLAAAANVADRSGMTQLAHLVALLAAHHVPLDLAFLYARRAPVRLRTERGWVSPGPSTSDRSVRLDVHLPVLDLAHDRPAPAPVPAPAAPAPAPAMPERDHVMCAYLETMDRFLDVQRTTLQAVLAAPALAPALALAAVPPTTAPTPTTAAASNGRPRRFPLLGSLVSPGADGELVALRRLDLDEDLFLHDHTFGGQRISVTDPSLLALPVVPMTVSMEILAEAALTLCPGLLVVGMDQIRAYQWIELDEGHATLRVTARRLVTGGPAAGGPERVKVEVARLGDGSETGTRMVEGTVLVASAYPAAEPVQRLDLEGERAYAHGTADLYPGRMFHGPRFQGVVSLDRWGRNGTEATLRILPAADLFASTDTPDLVTDPQLLDAAGQLVGFWADEEHDFAALPFALDGLQLFGPSPPAGTVLTGQARVHVQTEHQIRSDIDLAGPDGRLLARLTGWTNRCFPLPPPFNRPWASTRDAAFGAPWPALLDSLPDPASCAVRRMDHPPQLAGLGGSMLQRAVAKLLLGRRERAVWARLPGSDRERLEWLLGRAAAKECARAFLEGAYDLQLYPADVEIVDDEHGQPSAAQVAAQAPTATLVAIAGYGGVAVAVAGDGRRYRGLGIGLERPGPGGELDARLRCAVVAAGQALGTGPERLAAADLDPSIGAVRVTGPTHDGGDLVVRTIRDGEWVAATAVLHHAQGG